MIIVLEMKHGPYPVYARNAQEKAKAYLLLFKVLDSHGYYDGILEGDEIAAYEGAKGGKGSDAEWLMNIRSDAGWEHEQLSFIYPEAP